MYAIVQTGGKQYKVQPGDFVKVEKLPGEVGDQVCLSDVLAVAGPEGIQIGTPQVNKAVVKATILRIARDRKIIVFKKKRRKGYSKKQGHRQWYTLLRIEGIESAAGKPQPEPAPVQPDSGESPESTPEA